MKKQTHMVNTISLKMVSHANTSEREDNSSCPSHDSSEMDKMKKILKSPLTNRRHDTSNKTFGVQLSELLKSLPPGENIPFAVRRITEYILKYAISLEGIFRVNGNAKIVEKLKNSFDKTKDADLEDCGDTFAVAGLLKLFLRELPNGLINTNQTKELAVMYETYAKYPEICLEKVKLLLNELDNNIYCLIKYLCRFLVQVSLHEVHNKMSPIALGIVFGPNFFRCGDGINGLKEQGISNQIVCKFIVEYDTLFKTEGEISPYSIKLIQVKEAVKSKTPPARPPPPKIDDSPIPSPRRKKKYDFHIYRDDGEQSDDSYATPRSARTLPSPRLSDDDFSRSSSPFILDSDDGGASWGPSPNVSMSTSDLVEKTISAAVGQHIFGDDLSNLSSSDDPSTPVPAPRNKKREKKTKKGNHQFRGVNTLFVPEGKRFHCSDQDSYDSEDEIEKPKYKVKVITDVIDGFDSDVSTPSTPVPQPRSPKHKPVFKHPKSPQHQQQQRVDKDVEDTEVDIPHQMIESDDSGFGSIQRTQEALTGFKRNAGPKNRRTPTRGGTLSRTKHNWINGDDRNEVDESQKYKTYPPHKSKVFDLQNGEHELPIDSSDSEYNGSMNFLSIRNDCDNMDSPPDSSKQNRVPLLDLSTLHEQGDSRGNGNENGPFQTFSKNHYAAPSNNQISPRQFVSINCAPPSSTVISTSALQAQNPVTVVQSNSKEDQSVTIKLLTKKIQVYKKKIKQFEDTFEEEFGYRPCQTDKAARPDIRKYMTELAKVRKELKHIKEEQREKEQYHVLSEPPTQSNPFISQSGQSEGSDMHHTLDVIMRRLNEKRKEGSRPEDLALMNEDQIQDEKLAVQKALLYFESLYGRPSTRAEKELMRPLYDRYRNIKRIISNPSAFAENLDAAPEFLNVKYPSDCYSTFRREPVRIPTAVGYHSDDEGETNPMFMVTHNPDLLRNKSPPAYPLVTSQQQQQIQNSYEVTLHKKSMTELYEEQTHSKNEKRRLRRVLKEYEDEFFDETGRKVQKEDRAPMEAEYMAYKQVKAKLRLLDALITKSEPVASIY